MAEKPFNASSTLNTKLFLQNMLHSKYKFYFEIPRFKMSDDVVILNFPLLCFLSKDTEGSLNQGI